MTYQTPEPVESAPAASHPSVDQLADLHEGLLDPASAQPIRDHLATCPDCSDTLAALAELTALLGAEEPPAMPPDVARRIEAALAAAAADAPGTEAPPRPAAEAAPPTVPPRPNRRARTGQAHSATPPGGAPPNRTDRQARPRRTGFRRRAVALAAAGCLAVLGLGGTVLLEQSGWPSTSSAGGTVQRPASAVAGNTAGNPAGSPAPQGPVYTADQLPGQVQQLLAAQAPESPAGVPHATSEQAPATEGPSALPGCVQATVGSHAADHPLAVGHGRYGDTPVDVYVFRVAGDPTRLDVYLLDQGCAIAPSGTATVELHQVVPAH